MSTNSFVFFRFESLTSDKPVDFGADPEFLSLRERANREIFFFAMNSNDYNAWERAALAEVCVSPSALVTSALDTNSIHP